MKQRDYDSTVERIAGNIISGVLIADNLDLYSQSGPSARGLRIVRGAVVVARAIVAEVKRTESDREGA